MKRTERNYKNLLNLTISQFIFEAEAIAGVTKTALN